MTRSLFLMLLVALLAGVSAWAAATYHHHLRLQDAAAEELAVQEARQARSAELAAHVADLIRRSDAVVFDNGPVAENLRFTDQAWLERVAAVLAEASPQPTTPALGISLPQVLFHQGDEPLLVLDPVNHSRLRVLGLESGHPRGGDYLVDAATIDALRALIREKQPTSPLPQRDHGR